MRAQSRGQPKKSNLRADYLGANADRSVETTDHDPIDQILVELEGVFRSLWSSKTAENLSLLGNVTARQAERILAHDQRTSAQILIRLLRSQHGLRILWHLMEGADPEWWNTNRLGQRLASIQLQRAKLEQDEQAVALTLRARKAAS